MRDEAEEQQRMLIRSDNYDEMYFEKGGFRSERTDYSNPN